MTAEFVFSMANMGTLLGWAVLIAGVFLRRPFLRDTLAGLWWPAGLALLYTALIAGFFAQAQGGFDTLANVQLLFTSDWVALAGWIHYLAFDLFIGAWIARHVMELGLPRLLLIVLLPLTFMFGPAGLLTFYIAKLALARSPTPSHA